MADTEKDLLAINPDVPELAWAPKQNTEDTVTEIVETSEDSLETPEGASEELDLLAVNDKEPTLNWTTYNPEVLNEYTPPEEESWYDYPGALFRGIQDQMSNSAEAVSNPVDQLWDALSGGDVDLSKIRTSSDRYQSGTAQFLHQLGEGIGQIGVTIGAAKTGAAALAPVGAGIGTAVGGPGGTVVGAGIGAVSGGIAGAVSSGAINAAGQALEKYKSSYIDALQAGLSVDAAKKEATLKTWDSVPASVIEQLIPFGMGKIPGLNKLVAKGAVKVLPSGAIKILDKPAVKAILSSGLNEGLQESFEEIGDIGAEAYVGERAPITLGEATERVAVSGGLGALSGGVLSGGTHAIGYFKNENVIERTKEGYKKYTESNKKSDEFTVIDDATGKSIKASDIPSDSTGTYTITTDNGEKLSVTANTVKDLAIRNKQKDTDDLVVIDNATGKLINSSDIPEDSTGTYTINTDNGELISVTADTVRDVSIRRKQAETNDLVVIDNSTGKIVNASDVPSNSKRTYTISTDEGELVSVTANTVKDIAHQRKQASTNELVVIDDATGNPLRASEVPDSSTGTYTITTDSGEKMSVTASTVKDIASKYNQQETYTPVNEADHVKSLDSLENTQREWFNNNEVLDNAGNKVSYEGVQDNEVYKYTDAKGQQKNLLGSELLNLATGEKTALYQPKGMVITDSKTGKTVRLSDIPLGSKKTFNVTIDGEKVSDGVTARTVHHFAGLHKGMQISTRKNANGSTTTSVTTPSSTKLPGTDSNLTEEITDGSAETIITENPATLGDTKPGTVERAEAVQKQKRNTRKKAIKQSGVKMSLEVADNQSLVPGSGNQDTFAQTTETNNTQQTRLGKPDTIPTDPAEEIRVMNIDLAQVENDLAQQEKEAGVPEGGSLEDLVKAGKDIPPRLYKNKVRHLVNKLAGIMDTTIFDKLSQKGIGGNRTPKNAAGATIPKLGYARVRSSMNYVSALHEVAHNVWQTGSDLDSSDDLDVVVLDDRTGEPINVNDIPEDSTGTYTLETDDGETISVTAKTAKDVANKIKQGLSTDIHPGVVGIKELARKRGLSLEDLNDELQTLFPVIQSKLVLKEYDSKKVPEEIFCDTYAKYVTNSDIANTIKRVSPLIASLLDEHIDSMSGAREVVNQLRSINDAYNKLSSREKILANIELVSDKEATRLQKIKAWFGQAWLVSRVWTKYIDTTHFTRRAAQYLSNRNPDVNSNIENLSDLVEYVQATESYDAKAFLDGNGTTADGTDLGRQFRSVTQMTNKIHEVATALVDDKKDTKAVANKAKEINDNLLAYLYALDTLGSYTGNNRVMNNFRNLIENTRLPMMQLHGLMQVISNKFWNQFTSLNPITKKDLTKEQRNWLKTVGIDEDSTIQSINLIKKNIKMPSEKSLINIALSDKAYQHTVNPDGTVDLAKARATWLYKNYHLPVFDTVAETGITLVDAINTIVETEEDPLADTYKQLAAEYHTYQDSLLNYVQRYSKGGGAWVDSVRENGHAYYVPLLRMFENNEEQTDYPEINNRLYKMYSRQGSQRPIKNIWDSTVKQTNALVWGAHQSKIKEAFVDLAEATGGGRFIQERTDKKVKVALDTRDLLMQIKGDLETRKQELIAQGMDPKEISTGAVEDLYNSLYKANLARLNIFAPENNYKKLQEERTFTVWDSENNTLRYFQVDPSIWLSFNKQLLDPNSLFGKVNAFFGWFMNLTRKGLIDWNPVFNLITNPFYDAVTSTLKGDVKLFNLPDHPVVEAFIPFNRTLGSVVSLFTDYYQYIFQPQKMQAKYDLLEQLGQGFNMRRSTYEDVTKKPNAGKIIPMNPIRRMFTFRMWLGEEARTTDRWGRIRELEAYMKRNKISPEKAEISASRAASLTLTKGTLVGLGLDNKTLGTILTSEQLNAFNKAKDKDYVYMDLTKDQQDSLDKLVRDNNFIAENIKNQQLDFNTRVNLSRAIALATTDFSRGGYLTKNLNNVYLFSQAATNGLVQYGEVLRRKWYNGQKADVLGMLLEQLMLGYLAKAFGFVDDDQPYEDKLNLGRRWKIGENLTWTQPTQFPDQVISVLGEYLYDTLQGSTIESPQDLIKYAVESANPYKSMSFPGFVMDAASDKQLSRWSRKPIPGLSIWNEVKKVPPEEQITKATGWFAIQVAKWTGVPAAKVQYLMNNAGLRFWDRLLESTVGFDSGTVTTTGEWVSTSGGFIKNIMQNVVGIDKELYKTNAELGIDRLAEESLNKVIEASESGSIPQELLVNAVHAKQAKDIITNYTRMYYLARDVDLRKEINTKKVETAKTLFDMLNSKNIIPRDLLKNYLDQETAKRNNLKKYYKELDKRNANNPNKISGEMESIQKNLGQGVENVLSLFNSEANALPLEGMARYYGEEIFKDTPIGKNVLKEQAFREYQPAEGIIQDEIKNQVPEYTNSKGVKYRPNELQKDVRDNIQATLYDNIDNGIEETIYQISKAIENAPFPSSSSIRTLTAKEVMNNDIFKEKLKLAYKRPINMIDVEEAIADTLISKTITTPATAKFESGGKMWRVKPASKTDKNGHQIGGFGMYQLDPFAKGGDAKMREYINSSRFSSKLSEAYEGNKINYKKLSSIWQEISKNPLVAEAFAKDYEQFMMKEYLPQSLLNEYSRAGYDVGNKNVRDAIFSYSIQRPASARAFAESLPTAVGNSVSPETAIHNIMESKRTHPVLKKYSSRYNDEEEFLLEKERRENESRKRFSIF